jgi:hypothetical protein
MQFDIKSCFILGPNCVEKSQIVLFKIIHDMNEEKIMT